jgi:hypothetical protein
MNLEGSGGAGARLVETHDFFSGLKKMSNAHYLKLTIETVLDQIKGDNLNKQILKESYEKFEKEYKSIVKSKLVIKYDENENIIMPDINSCLASISTLSNKKIQRWSNIEKENLPSLIANIFAVWTLTNADRYLKILKEDPSEPDLELYKLQPHPA